MKVDTVTMFTSEIKAAEINSLSDELTLVIPSDFDVEIVAQETEGTTTVRMARR